MSVLPDEKLGTLDGDHFERLVSRLAEERVELDAEVLALRAEVVALKATIAELTASPPALERPEKSTTAGAAEHQAAGPCPVPQADLEARIAQLRRLLQSYLLTEAGSALKHGSEVAALKKQLQEKDAELERYRRAEAVKEAPARTLPSTTAMAAGAGSKRPFPEEAHPGQKRKQVRAELVSVGGYTAPPSRHRTVLATSGEESDGQLIAHKTPRSNRDLPEGAIGVPARRFRSDHLPPLVLAWRQLMPQLTAMIDPGRGSGVDARMRVERAVFGAGEAREAPTWDYEGDDILQNSLKAQVRWMLNSATAGDGTSARRAVEECLEVTDTHVRFLPKGLLKYGLRPHKWVLPLRLKQMRAANRMSVESTQLPLPPPQHQQQQEEEEETDEEEEEEEETDEEEETEEEQYVEEEEEEEEETEDEEAGTVAYDPYNSMRPSSQGQRGPPRTAHRSLGDPICIPNNSCRSTQVRPLLRVWSRLMPQLGKRKYVSLVDFFNVESTIFGAGETREAPTWAYEGHSTFAISVVDQMQWMLKSGHMEEEHVGSAVTDCLNFTHSHVFMQEEGLRKHGLYPHKWALPLKLTEMRAANAKAAQEEAE